MRICLLPNLLRRRVVAQGHLTFFRIEQVGGNKDGNMVYAWAVHDSDVTAPVPDIAVDRKAAGNVW